ncbi:MAG: 3-methyl-2-oxobutanoate hydroxymethyltransferase [Proteobacteria bacterium]|nr:MAG: 3-methyl-2-oxobutanoate hydroxymethyltransferase [Pseudomonadota bacterium]
MSVQTEIRRHTLRTLGAMKGKERVAMLTAYDVVTAQCLDEAGTEILLVGDSFGNVIYGFDSTLPVTMEMMLAHTGAVVRGSKRAFVVADLPFLTYQISAEEALRHAGACLAQGGAQAVKLEGAYPDVCETIRRLVQAGIPVMGHIGLTPQSVHQMGGYYTHGKSESDADRIYAEAKALEAAGCFAVVLECVTESLAAKITASLSCLTIGIGSGKVCDGEVLVINDVLGYSPGRAPKFAAPRADLKTIVREAAAAYVKATKEKL